jgi:hypothetical protein
MSQQDVSKNKKDVFTTPVKESKGLTKTKSGGKQISSRKNDTEVKIEQFNSSNKKKPNKEDLKNLRKKSSRHKISRSRSNSYSSKYSKSNSSISRSISRSRSRNNSNFRQRKRLANKQNLYFRENPERYKDSYVSSQPGRNGNKVGWLCKNHRCRNINFLSRKDCYKCRTYKPSSPIYMDLPFKDFNKCNDNKCLPKLYPISNDSLRLPNPINDKSYIYLPRILPIESEFSYPLITSAIQLLNKSRVAKCDDEILELIKNLNNQIHNN